MKKKIKIIPYIIVIAVSFYLFPNLVVDEGMRVMLLISITPPVCFIASALYGAQNKKMDSLFVLLVATIFLPSVFIPWFSISFLSLFLFWLVAVIGSAIGVFYTRQQG